MQTERARETHRPSSTRGSVKETTSRVGELRTTRAQAVTSWLKELAYLQGTGLRANATLKAERQDLARVTAGEVGRLGCLYPHEATAWSFTLTVHYLQTQRSNGLTIRRILAALPGLSERAERAEGTGETKYRDVGAETYALGADGRDRELVRGWLDGAENVLSEMVRGSTEALASVWGAQQVYCSAQRELLDRLIREGAVRAATLDENRLGKLQRAAQQGDARAAYAWGLAELNGIGGVARPETGVRWIERAALAGHVEAQYELGVIHSNGWSVPRDRIAGLAWFGLAREAGHDAAVRKYGELERQMSAEDTERAEEMRRTLSAPRPTRADA